MSNPHRSSRYVRSRDPWFHVRQIGERVANSLNTSLARVVELADTGGLNPPLLREVRVRPPPRARFQASADAPCGKHRAREASINRRLNRGAPEYADSGVLVALDCHTRPSTTPGGDG